MKIREDYLIIINSKNRIQQVRIYIDKDPIEEVYTINRYTGQYGGKEVERPSLTIDKGKVKRTTAEQTTLQYNSLIKGYLDKGYVKLSSITDKQYNDLTEQELKDLLGSDVVSDQSGVPKPMLAKLSDDCSATIWNKSWYVSRKIDGVRCLMYFKDGEIHTASRGGGTYDAATTHLRTNPQLLKIFDVKPDLILDGEIYHHGADWPLQRISGLSRLQEWKEECNNLEYWIYDYVSDDSFKERIKYLEQLKNEVDGKEIRILEQKLMTGYMSIKKEHDLYVQEGFEGLCARNPDKEYGINKRSGVYLIKLKMRKDAEFEITGIRTGLRDEDMCFTLKTKEGKEFAAKPVGNAESRKYFLENCNEFIGKMATCTYFSLSSDGIPTQPVLKSIRPDDE